MSSHNSLDNALAHLQLIFPAHCLPRTRHNHLLQDTLNRICHSLPVPDAANREVALQTMRQIIDQQEYKYQRSLLMESHIEQLRLFEEEECFYEQPSTGVLSKKDTVYTHCDDPKPDMVDDVWGWKEEKHDPHEEYLLFID